MNFCTTIYLQDIEYTHLLYNTFGPITCTIKNNSVTKFQTNNGTGKTILLKTLIGLLLPKKGLLLFQTNIYTKNNNISNRLSNSQSKKYNLLLESNKKNFLIFDEPYSFLDITSIIFYKKKIKLHLNKKGTIILTDCLKKIMLPSIIYYTGLSWI
jgi:ABC-type transport system involved in cytochrome c biogenesis ATPase subunit